MVNNPGPASLVLTCYAHPNSIKILLTMGYATGWPVSTVAYAKVYLNVNGNLVRVHDLVKCEGINELMGTIPGLEEGKAYSVYVNFLREDILTGTVLDSQWLNASVTTWDVANVVVGTTKTYYISPTGSDAADGLTTSTPKKHLSAFTQSMFQTASVNVGGEIIFMPGEYDLQDIGNGQRLQDVSGAAGAYIRLRPLSTDPGDAATIKGWKYFNGGWTRVAGTCNVFYMTGVTELIGSVYYSSKGCLCYPYHVLTNEARANTVGSGSAAGTIVLDTGASGSNNTYNGMVVEYINAAGTHREERYIVSYAGSSKTATISGTWSVTPVAGDTFRVTRQFSYSSGKFAIAEPGLYRDMVGWCMDSTTSRLYMKTEVSYLRTNTVAAATSNTVTLDAGADVTNDFYKDGEIEIISGVGAGQRIIITAYDGTTKVATLNKPWFVQPTATSGYSIRRGDAPANDTVRGSYQNNGLILRRCDYIMLENLKFRQFGLSSAGMPSTVDSLYGLYVGESTDYNIIRRCTFTDCGIFLSEATANFTVIEDCGLSQSYVWGQFMTVDDPYYKHRGWDLVKNSGLDGSAIVAFGRHTIIRRNLILDFGNAVLSNIAGSANAIHTDVYQNTGGYFSDECYELDSSGGRNFAAWFNQWEGVHNHVSCSPYKHGPLFVISDVVTDYRFKPLKMGQQAVTTGLLDGLGPKFFYHCLWDTFSKGYTVHQFSMAQASTSTTITLASNVDLSENYVNWQIEIITGPGTGQLRTISSFNSGTKVATITAAWTTQPTADSRYYIYQPNQADLSHNGGFGALTVMNCIGYATSAYSRYLINGGSGASVDAMYGIKNKYHNNSFYSVTPGSGDQWQWSIAYSATSDVERSSVSILDNIAGINPYPGGLLGDVAVELRGAGKTVNGVSTVAMKEGIRLTNPPDIGPFDAFNYTIAGIRSGMLTGGAMNSGGIHTGGSL